MIVMNIQKQREWIKNVVAKVIMNIKKQRVWIKNVVAKINHNEYKDVLLTKKSLGHLINKIQNSHKIEAYAISKISLSCFDDKIHIQNNEYDGLALGW